MKKPAGNYKRAGADAVRQKIARAMLAGTAAAAMLLLPYFAEAQNPTAAQQAAPVPIGTLSLQNASLAEVVDQLAQRLALNMASNTPHEPFFAPFFNTLATSTPEQRDALETSLRTFLGSAAVNERTDDDKTLVLAVFAS